MLLCYPVSVIPQQFPRARRSSCNIIIIVMSATTTTSRSINRGSGAESLVVVLALLEEEKDLLPPEEYPVGDDDNITTALAYRQKHPDRRGSDIGSFLAQRIAGTLLQPPTTNTTAAAAATATDLTQPLVREAVWRRSYGRQEDEFPFRYCAAVIVVSEQLVQFLEQADQEEEVEPTEKGGLLADLHRVIQATNSKDRIVLLFCFGISIIDVRERCVLLKRLLDQDVTSATAIRIDGFTSGEHMNTTLQVCVSSTFEVLRSRFPQHLEKVRHELKRRSRPVAHAHSFTHGGEQQQEDSQPVQDLASALEEGTARSLYWSFFPSVYKKSAPHRLSLSQAKRLVDALSRCPQPCILQTIQLRGNHLGDTFFCQNFCACLKFCSSLKFLLVAHNDIGIKGAKALADAIEQSLASLELLFIHDNQIGDEGFRAIVHSLTKINSIKTLNVDANGITYVPKKIAELKSLVWLKLCRNKITVLPFEITSLNLQCLQLKGNPLREPPICIVSTSYDGSESGGSTTVQYVKEYFSGKRKHGSIVARVLGDAQSGKTTFIQNYLKHHGVQDTTHGVTKGARLRNGSFIRFMEFGGSVDSYPLHPAFLESVCTVYIILVRADSPSATQSAFFWLSYVASLANVHSMDERYRSPLVLCSTCHDLASHPSASSRTTSSSQVIVDHLVTIVGSGRVTNIDTKFDLETATTHDLDYGDVEGTAQFWTKLDQVAAQSADATDFLPSKYASFLEFCRRRENNGASAMQEVKKLSTAFIQEFNKADQKEIPSAQETHQVRNPPEEQRRADETSVETALKVLTQLGEMVHVSGMTHVHTNQQSFLRSLTAISSSLQKNSTSGTCTSIEVKKILHLSSLSEAESMLESMRCLSLCFPVPPVGLLLGGAGSLTSEHSRHDSTTPITGGTNCKLWVFPGARTHMSNRWDTIRFLEQEGELHGKESITGLRFETTASFLPPLILTLVEVRLRSLGVVLTATRNTVVLSMATKNRVVLHYNHRLHFLDAVSYSENTEASAIARNTISVAVSRAIDTHFPTLALKQSALCQKCLTLEDCCCFPLKLDRESGMPIQPSTLWQCRRLDVPLPWSELVPLAGWNSNSGKDWAFDVFISHAGEDTPLALDIWKWLTNIGLRCFVDETMLSHTCDAERTIPDAIQNSRLGICIITMAFCRKQWPKREYAEFRSREQKVKQALLPILIDMSPSRFVDRSGDANCEWVSHNGFLQLEGADTMGKGRVDLAPGDMGFSIESMREICNLVLKALGAASDSDGLVSSQTDLPQRSTASWLSALMDLSWLRFVVLQSRRRRLNPPVLFEYDAFVSHASEDKDVARPLKRKLEEFGWNVFLDDESIRLGEEIRGRIYRALSSAKVGIFILTERFFEKPWPVREAEIFRKEESVGLSFGSRRIVVPVFPQKTFPEHLSSYPLFDWFSKHRAYTAKDFTTRVDGILPEDSPHDNSISKEEKVDNVKEFAEDAAVWLCKDTNNDGDTETRR